MLTTSLSRDLYQTFIEPGATEERVLSVSRIAGVLAGIAGIIFAALLPDVITALTIFYSILSVALFVPLLAGLYSSKPTANGALITILTSISVMVVIHILTDGTGIADISPATW